MTETKGERLMKDLLVRFIKEEDGDVVQNVIIIAIFAALALFFGNSIKEFVMKLIENIGRASDETEKTVSELLP